MSMVVMSLSGSLLSELLRTTMMKMWLWQVGDRLPWLLGSQKVLDGVMTCKSKTSGYAWWRRCEPCEGSDPLRRGVRASRTTIFLTRKRGSERTTLAWILTTDVRIEWEVVGVDDAVMEYWSVGPHNSTELKNVLRLVGMIMKMVKMQFSCEP